MQQRPDAERAPNGLFTELVSSRCVVVVHKPPVVARSVPEFVSLFRTRRSLVPFRCSIDVKASSTGSVKSCSERCNVHPQVRSRLFPLRC